MGFRQDEDCRKLTHQRSTDQDRASDDPKSSVSVQVHEIDREAWRIVHNGNYWGTFSLNFLSVALPALYLVLSKLWIVALDRQFIAITDTFIYTGIVAEVLNQGFPKAAWSLLGDSTQYKLDERYGLAHTLLTIEFSLASILFTVLCAAAPSFCESYVPAVVRSQSITYVRLTSISTFCSVLNTTLSICTRSLDKPEIPLVISTVKVTLNIVLDLVFLSPFRPTRIQPSVNTQAITRACCDIASILAGFLHFWAIQYRLRKREPSFGQRARPSFAKALRLLKTGSWFQIEVVVRTALTMWLLATSNSMGWTWMAAYGTFLTIRLGIGFVPLLTAEATCLALTGHAWGAYRSALIDGSGLHYRDRHRHHPRIFKPLFRAVILSSGVVLLAEIALYFSVGFGYGRKLAYFLTNSEEVAHQTVEFWRTIAWCYGFLAVYFQTSSILLVCNPKWYLFQSLFTTITCALPFTVAFFFEKGGSNPILWWSLACGGVYVWTLIVNVVATGVWTKVRWTTK